MSSWQLYPTLSASMPFQMAFDEVLFRRFYLPKVDSRTSNPILRFYYSSEPSVTVGYSYRGPIMDHDRGICRRITGGGRVEHGNDLIFSLLGRREHDESFASVRVSYWKIHEAVKSAFSLIGMKSEFYRSDADLPAGPDCFKYPIATDLSYQNRKLAGGAQKRSQGAFLHQESIQVPRPVSYAQVENAIQKGFSEIFRISWSYIKLTPELFDEAQLLMNEKYMTQEHNLKK